MSPDEAVAGVEESSRRLAAMDRTDLKAVESLLDQRAAAIESLASEARPTAEHRERLRRAFDEGEQALHELRLARASARAALANLNGALYVLQGITPAAPAETALVDFSG